jgi:imidazolonepropionase
VLRRVETEKSTDITVHDAEGRVVIPGLVDAHTHLVFAGTRALEYEQKIRGASYLDILAKGGGILNSVERTRKATHSELLDSARKRARTMVAAGSTTIEVKSGYGLSLEAEVKMLEVVSQLNSALPVEFVPTLMSAHAVPSEYEGNSEKYVEYMLEHIIPEIARRRLAEFSDVFCEKGVFSVEQSRRILLESAKWGMRPKIHADEIVPLGGAELAAQVGAVSADHLVAPSDEGIVQLADSETVAVLLPATSLFLGLAKRAPAREMIRRGVAVALATDFNPGTSPVMSMQLVMSLACSYLRMTPQEALTAATINSAYAVGRGERAGALEKTRQADIVIMDAEDFREVPYFMGSNLACAVIKKGVIVARDGNALF